MSYHAALGVELDVGVETDCYKGGGSTRDTAVACAGEAGGKAAAGACVAIGAGAAAPLCNEIGTFVAKQIAGPLYDGASQVFEAIFGGPKGTPPHEAHARGAWHVDVARMTYDLLAASIILKYAVFVVPAVSKAGGKADPMQLWRAKALLDTFGAKKMMADQIASGKPYGLYPTIAMKCWFTGKEWWLPYREIGQLNSAACGMMLADPLADAWRTSMASAYGKALQWITNDAAKQVAKATAQAQAEAWRKSLPDAPKRELTTSSSGSGLLWLAGLGAVGAGGWWWLGRKKKRR